MSEFPSLAEVLATHRYKIFPGQCACQEPGEFMREAAHREHQADAWRGACTVRTVEELLVLPAGIVIHTKRDGAVEKFSDGHWYLPARRDAVSLQRVVDNLPVLLIWSPDWEQR